MPSELNGCQGQGLCSGFYRDFLGLIEGSAWWWPFRFPSFFIVSVAGPGANLFRRFDWVIGFRK